MKSNLFIIFSLLFWFSGLSQKNLIGNGSFEDLLRCPGYSYSEGSADILENWNNYTVHGCGVWSPGVIVLNQCAQHTRKFMIEYNQKEQCHDTFKGTPSNALGEIIPIHGKGYVAVNFISPFVLAHESEVEGAYLQGKLKEKLVKGKKYYLEFYISPIKYCKFVSNGIGAVLSKEPMRFSDFSPNKKHTPSVQYTDKKLKLKYKKWTKISGVIEASGNEEFITIGNFIQFDELLIRRLFVKSASKYNGKTIENFTYFIDDVKLFEIE